MREHLFTNTGQNTYPLPVIQYYGNEYIKYFKYLFVILNRIIIFVQSINVR